MRTATERCSMYESSHVPVGRGARTPRAASRTDNFTQGLRSEPNGSCRKLRRKCTQEPSQTESAVIADRTHPDPPPPAPTQPPTVAVSYNQPEPQPEKPSPSYQPEPQPVVYNHPSAETQPESPPPASSIIS